MDSGLVTDGVLAQDINQTSSFWHIREVITIYILYLHSGSSVHHHLCITSSLGIDLRCDPMLLSTVASPFVVKLC